MEKQNYSIQAQQGKHKININLDIDIDRELTKAEKDHISEFMYNLRVMIGTNNTILSSEFKEDCEQNKRELLGCFSDMIYVKEIPTEYNPSYPLPWFLVTTNKGLIKIGWRKRVINIDWSGSDININADTLFPDEDTTKGEKYIHAWGVEKAKEYITKLLA